MYDSDEVHDAVRRDMRNAMQVSTTVSQIGRAGLTADETAAGMRRYLEMTEIRLTNGGIQ